MATDEAVVCQLSLLQSLFYFRAEALRHLCWHHLQSLLQTFIEYLEDGDSISVETRLSASKTMIVIYLMFYIFRATMLLYCTVPYCNI